MKPECKVGANGNEYWYFNGKFHREDGPAIEYADGSKEWWLNDLRHREDGPAVEWVHGEKQWWLNGKLHREDGPAIETVSGKKEWWLNGAQYSSEEIFRLGLEKLKKEEMKKALRKAEISAEKNNTDLKETMTSLSESMMALSEAMTSVSESMRALSERRKKEALKKVDSSGSRDNYTQKKEEKKMESRISRTKSEITTASVRLLVNRVIKMAHKVVISQFTQNVRSRSEKAKLTEGISRFLETNSGRALLSIAIGSILSELKAVSGFEEYGGILDLVGQEARIQGFQLGGESLIDNLAPEFFAEVQSLKTLLADEKIRVAPYMDMAESKNKSEDPIVTNLVTNLQSK